MTVHRQRTASREEELELLQLVLVIHIERACASVASVRQCATVKGVHIEGESPRVEEVCVNLNLYVQCAAARLMEFADYIVYGDCQVLREGNC